MNRKKNKIMEEYRRKGRRTIKTEKYNVTSKTNKKKKQKMNNCNRRYIRNNMTMIVKYNSETLV